MFILGADGAEDSFTAVVLLPIALAFIMATLGLSLEVADFRRVLSAPKAIAIGLANLVVIAPLLAVTMAELFDLSPAFAVGLVVLGAAPGGTLANLMTHASGGDTALSVSMTAISSVGAVITVPVYLSLSTSWFDAKEFAESVNMLGVCARVFLITIVPLALGMWWRTRDRARADEIRGRAGRFAFGLFAVVVVAAVAGNWERITEDFTDIIFAALGLNVGGMLVSLLISRAAGLTGPQATAIGIELGIHNSTLAIAVGATIATELTIPAAVYSSFMFLTAGAFARLMYHRNQREAPAAAVVTPA